ncbi:MAG: RNA polymerase sigma factor [Parvibaculaceae bacterium]|nr:RNA polymerase sigma factor [Parvibaculaceae bacterium]
MTGESRETLRQFLVLDYEDLRRRLTHRLGSSDLAGDVLHETWLRLAQARTIGPVRSPKLYLLRVAMNIAFKRLRRDGRLVTLSDAKVALGIPDDAPDPARAAEAHFEVEALMQALGEISPRQREILLASRLEGIPLREIAERQGISQRMVEIELRRALAYCALCLDREVIQRFGPKSSRASGNQDS